MYGYIKTAIQHEKKNAGDDIHRYRSHYKYENRKITCIQKNKNILKTINADFNK